MNSTFETGKEIATSKEERLATGMDLTGKLVYNDKAIVIFKEAYGVVMDYGANKYDYGNFESAPFNYDDVLGCIARHFNSYVRGERVDQESFQLHIGHIIARSAIAIMKASRETYNEDGKRFIGWKTQDVVSILDIMSGVFREEDYTKLAPKKIPSSAHVTVEMLEAVAETPFFKIVDKYSLNSWVKTFSICLVNFLCTSINGEPVEDKILHAKVLLWIAINIYYLDTKGE